MLDCSQLFNTSESKRKKIIVELPFNSVSTLYLWYAVFIHECLVECFVLVFFSMATVWKHGTLLYFPNLLSLWGREKSYIPPNTSWDCHLGIHPKGSRYMYYWIFDSQESCHLRLLSQSLIRMSLSQVYLAHNLEETSIPILGATISFRTVMFQREIQSLNSNHCLIIPHILCHVHQCQNDQQSPIMSFSTSCIEVPS